MRTYQWNSYSVICTTSQSHLKGRSLQNAIVNLGIEDNCAQGLRGLGLHLEELYEEEQDAGLGNSSTFHLIIFPITFLSNHI